MLCAVTRHGKWNGRRGGGMACAEGWVSGYMCLNRDFSSQSSRAEPFGWDVGGVWVKGRREEGRGGLQVPTENSRDLGFGRAVSLKERVDMEIVLKEERVTEVV